MPKLRLLVIGFFAGASLAISVPAAPAAPVTLTFTVPTGFALGCCAEQATIEPTVVTLPIIGRATVSGYWYWCGTPCGDDSGTGLLLLFDTPSGTLRIDGLNRGLFPGDSNLTWSVTTDTFSLTSTGRFASASGSGRWSVSGDPYVSQTFTLSGTLSLR